MSLNNSVMIYSIDMFIKILIKNYTILYKYCDNFFIMNKLKFQQIQNIIWKLTPSS